MPLKTIKYTWKPLTVSDIWKIATPFSCQTHCLKTTEYIFIKTLLRCFLNSETPGRNFSGYCFRETYHIGFWIVMFYTLPDWAKLLQLIFSFGKFHLHIQYATLLKHTLRWNTSEEVGQILRNQYIDLLIDFFIRFTKNNVLSSCLTFLTILFQKAIYFAVSSIFQLEGANVKSFDCLAFNELRCLF